MTTRLKPLVTSLLAGLLLAISGGGMADTPLSSPLEQAAQQNLITLPFNPEVVDFTQADDWQGLINKLADYQVIFHGEIHNRLSDHLIQAELLHLMHQHTSALAVGVEWFQAPFQAWVDGYIAGRLDEGELLQRTEYFSRWRYDWRLLQPLMQYARDHQIRVLALNAPAELTRQIAREGLDSLSHEQRVQLPKIHPPHPDHEQRLRDFFGQNLAEHANTDNFIHAQRTWDETMAANAAAWLRANPNTRMLVIAGQFHLDYQQAIIGDMLRHLPSLAGQTLSLANGPFEEWQSGRFDGFLLTDELALPAHGRIGSHITPQGQACLREIIADSAADWAGLQVGDCIIAFNHQPIRHFSDLMLALYQTQPDQQVQLKINRPISKNHNKKQVENHTLTIELTLD
ncbi:ChaN family lipoprotein [Thiomicrospira sp. ALE5]|uniref:ChaN family lipoprotein n=1 Tax=Thiomicrospira sp. ALE5 TaxID=748650 RepID=UPI0008EED67C|nr:ChaN family lipoprotein [Thiomicrospira sp. ALE5]SFR52733.1 PDZ domain-containing protein [Thiomicrospira sp. ALE5]